MIAVLKGYDSKEKDLEERGYCTALLPHFIDKHFHPDGCTHKYFRDEGD